MLWTAVAALCLAALLAPGACYSPRFEWLDREGFIPQDQTDETLRVDTELGDDLMADKRALSMLSRWKPFTDTFKVSDRPSRGKVIGGEYLPRGLEVVSAETRGTLRPLGAPLRWGRR